MRHAIKTILLVMLHVLVSSLIGLQGKDRTSGRYFATRSQVIARNGMMTIRLLNWNMECITVPRSPEKMGRRLGIEPG